MQRWRPTRPLHHCRCADQLNRKLVRRHPHVFGDEASRAAGNRADVDAAVEGSSAAVLRNWKEIKAAEKALHRAGASSAQGFLCRDWMLFSMRCPRWPRLPNWEPRRGRAVRLERIGAICSRSWPRRRGARGRGCSAIRRAHRRRGGVGRPAVYCGQSEPSLGVDAEMALRGCNRRFRQRFYEMSWPRRSRLKSLRRTNWKCCGRRRSGNWPQSQRTGRACDRIPPESISRAIDPQGLKPS